MCSVHFCAYFAYFLCSALCCALCVPLGQWRLLDWWPWSLGCEVYDELITIHTIHSPSLGKRSLCFCCPNVFVPHCGISSHFGISLVSEGRGSEYLWMLQNAGAFNLWGMALQRVRPNIFREVLGPCAWVQIWRKKCSKMRISRII